MSILQRPPCRRQVPLWQFAPALDELRVLIGTLFRQAHTIAEHRAAHIAPVDPYERTSGDGARDAASAGRS